MMTMMDHWMIRLFFLTVMVMFRVRTDEDVMHVGDLPPVGLETVQITLLVGIRVRRQCLKQNGGQLSGRMVFWIRVHFPFLRFLLLVLLLLLLSLLLLLLLLFLLFLLFLLCLLLLQLLLLLLLLGIGSRSSRRGRS